MSIQIDIYLQYLSNVGFIGVYHFLVEWTFIEYQVISTPFLERVSQMNETNRK